LLLEWDRLTAVANLHLQAIAAGGDRQSLVAELADDIERLSRRLLQCEAQLVRRNRALDFRAHVCGDFEEAVRRHEPVERLMRSLKVVVVDEVFESLLRVNDMREHGATEKLFPDRSPKPLHLAERLRGLRSTSNVPDAPSLE